MTLSARLVEGAQGSEVPARGDGSVRDRDAGTNAGVGVAVVREKEYRRFWERADRHTAVVLGARGSVQVESVEDAFTGIRSGFYVTDARSRFWLARPIRRGWVTVFVEGNPEAVTERKPVGFTAENLRQVMGPYPVRVVMAGAESARGSFTLKRVVLVVAILVSMVVAGVVWYNQKGG